MKMRICPKFHTKLSGKDVCRNCGCNDEKNCLELCDMEDCCLDNSTNHNLNNVMNSAKDNQNEMDDEEIDEEIVRILMSIKPGDDTEAKEALIDELRSKKEQNRVPIQNNKSENVKELHGNENLSIEQSDDKNDSKFNNAENNYSFDNLNSNDQYVTPIECMPVQNIMYQGKDAQMNFTKRTALIIGSTIIVFILIAGIIWRSELFSPGKAVEEYLDAFSSNLPLDQYGPSQNDIILSIFPKGFDDAPFENAVMKIGSNIKYKINSESKDGKTAVVSASITGLNLGEKCISDIEKIATIAERESRLSDGMSYKSFDKLKKLRDHFAIAIHSDSCEETTWNVNFTLRLDGFFWKIISVEDETTLDALSGGMYTCLTSAEKHFDEYYENAQFITEQKLEQKMQEEAERLQLEQERIEQEQLEKERRKEEAILNYKFKVGNWVIYDASSKVLCGQVIGVDPQLNMVQVHWSQAYDWRGNPVPKHMESQYKVGRDEWIAARNLELM